MIKFWAGTITNSQKNQKAPYPAKRDTPPGGGAKNKK